MLLYVSNNSIVFSKNTYENIGNLTNETKIFLGFTSKAIKRGENECIFLSLLQYCHLRCIIIFTETCIANGYSLKICVDGLRFPTM